MYTVNKSVMSKPKTPNFLQFEFVSKRVSKPSSVVGGSTSSQAKTTSVAREMADEEEKRSQQSEEATFDDKITTHMADCEILYGDELPSSCLRILLEGGDEDHHCLARALRSLEILVREDLFYLT